MKEAIYISSRTNQFVIRMHSLSDKKYRDSERLFRFDGLKLFEESAACGISPEYVLLREDIADRYLPLIADKTPSAQPVILSGPAFSKITEEKAPQGIICVAGYIDRLHKSFDNNSDAAAAAADEDVIAVESVQDPGNLGTVIRSAAAFGVGTLLLSSDCADIYHPRTVRAAMGAVFSRRIIRTSDLPGALKSLSSSGRRVLGAALSSDAVRLSDISVKRSDIFVIGNEGHGLSEAVVAACNGTVFIPMPAGRGVEALNAAVAASVIMSERKRC
ncbi:MAG: RNA methyltransferase [Clostridia bacterium]|nr:RNA methyltransferase [Clostridia bacterium]